jgi:hypothetical protein
MKLYQKILLIPLVIIGMLFFLSEFVYYRHPIIKQPLPTKLELSLCNKVKPEFNSRLVVEPNRMYWIMESGKIKICVHNRKH